MFRGSATYNSFTSTGLSPKFHLDETETINISQEGTGIQIKTRKNSFQGIQKENRITSELFVFFKQHVSGNKNLSVKRWFIWLVKREDHNLVKPLMVCFSESLNSTKHSSQRNILNLNWRKTLGLYIYRLMKLWTGFSMFTWFHKTIKIQKFIRVKNVDVSDLIKKYSYYDSFLDVQNRPLVFFAWFSIL